MNEGKLNELTDQELLKKKKEFSTIKKFYFALTGFCIAIAVYSVLKKGISVSAFIPLILVLWLMIWQRRNRAIEEEIKSRNLE